MYVQGGAWDAAKDGAGKGAGGAPDDSVLIKAAARHAHEQVGIDLRCSILTLPQRQPSELAQSR
jgi:hypothetical protein